MKASSEDVDASRARHRRHCYRGARSRPRSTHCRSRYEGSSDVVAYFFVGRVHRAILVLVVSTLRSRSDWREPERRRQYARAVSSLRGRYRRRCCLRGPGMGGECAVGLSAQAPRCVCHRVHQTPTPMGSRGALVGPSWTCRRRGGPRRVCLGSVPYDSARPCPRLRSPAAGASSSGTI